MLRQKLIINIYLLHLVGLLSSYFTRSSKIFEVLKDIVLSGQENNLPHHSITDKAWYIDVVVLHTQTDLRYRLVDKEGSRKLRFPDFVTTAQDGGKVVSLMHRPPFYPQEILPVLISVRG